MVLARLPIENSLTVLDLSMIGGLNDLRGAHMPNFQSIKLVVDKCRKLTDLIWTPPNFDGYPDVISVNHLLLWECN